MAAVAVTPREIALELWLQGFNVPQISKQINTPVNTIRSWRVRDRWVKPGPKPPTEALAASLSGVAERLANLTLIQCERIMCAIRDADVVKLRDCKEASTALAAAYATARKALGLDDAQPALHLHYHGAGRPDTVPPAPRPVIDVAPTPQQVVVEREKLDPPSATH